MGINSESIKNLKNKFLRGVENVAGVAKTVIPEFIDKVKETYKEQFSKSQLREFDENE